MPATLYLVVRISAALAMVTIALRWPQVGSSILRALESRLYLFARRRWLAIVTVGGLAIVGSAAIALATRIPQPYITDEFGHLLGAETLASGRLSNPTHPMWRHFESPQVLQKPTYVSRYPPGQALLFAVGEIVGQPIIGVWLGAGLACGAICWMLQGWFRPGIAFVGALLALYKIGVTTYFSQSYWGGMMAVLGGALIYGAVKRVLVRPQVGASIALAVGLALLAITRPFEGFLASVPVFVVLVYRALRRQPERTLFLKRVVAPICATGLLALLWMGYYNFRQTGHATLTAYQVYSRNYQVSPIFTWGRPVLQQSPMAAINAMAKWSTGAPRPTRRQHLIEFWTFYCGVAFTLPLLLALFAMRSYYWCALVSVAAVLGGLIVGSPSIFQHYAAPMAGPFFILVTYGLSRLRAIRFGGRRTGLFVARMLVLFCVATLVLRIAGQSLGVKQESRHGSLVALATFALTSGPPIAEWPYQRAAMEGDLERSGGAHLIVVRYSPNHNPNQEWVYNKPDIDRAAVVWARAIDPQSDQKLIEYFHSRRIWLLDADQPSPKLVPYPGLSSAQATSIPGSGIKLPARSR